MPITGTAEQGGPRGKGPSKHRLRGARPPKILYAIYTHARKLHLEPTLMATSSPADIRTDRPFDSCIVYHLCHGNS